MTKPRVISPERRQVRLIPTSIEDALPQDHAVRDIWSYVEGLDLSALHANIKAVEGEPGRPAIDPRLLLALWVFATTEGIGSARALAECCTRDIAYMWLCGGVGVNYHTLADFRSKNEAAFRRVLQDHVVSLVAAGVVRLTEIVQDGVRVHAHAGKNSFRTRAKLKELRRDVEARIKALSHELHDDPAATSRRMTAARERALHDRKARIEKAIEQSRVLDQQKAQSVSHRSKVEQAEHKRRADNDETEASTTDPESTFMKLADGGSRPAFNIQTALDPKSRIVVDVMLTQKRNDIGLLPPMVEQIETHYGYKPHRVVADGGYISRRDIDVLESSGVEVVAPVPSRGPDRDRFAEPKVKDLPGVAAWRSRMNTADGRAAMRGRMIIEWVFARFRNWGLRQLPVRGRSPCESVFLLHAITHNILIARFLR
jgi:transposase